MWEVTPTIAACWASQRGARRRGKSRYWLTDTRVNAVVFYCTVCSLEQRLTNQGCVVCTARQESSNPFVRFFQQQIKKFKRKMYLRRANKAPVVLGDRARAVAEALECKCCLLV